MIQSAELMPTHDSSFKLRAKGLKILRASLTLSTHRAVFKFSRLLLKMLSFSRGKPISWVYTLIKIFPVAFSGVSGESNMGSSKRANYSPQGCIGCGKKQETIDFCHEKKKRGTLRYGHKESGLTKPL